MSYVCKFGGSSVSSREKFLKIRDIIRRDQRRSIVVVSAIGKSCDADNKITDLLYLLYAHINYGVNYDLLYESIKHKFASLAASLELKVDMNSLFDELKKSLNKNVNEEFLVSRGEYFTAIMTAEFLGFRFLDAASFITFDMHGNVDIAKSKEKFDKLTRVGEKIVVPGFYGAYPNGKIKLFSRGGSDITGAVMANLAKAELYENWTDVDGILSADPKIVDNPKTVSCLNYEELRELSYMGAKVLHEETVIPLRSQNIPINIKNVDNPEGVGTLICDSCGDGDVVTGISGRKNFISVTISKQPQFKKTAITKSITTLLEKYSLELEHMPSSVDSISIVLEKEQTENCLMELISDLKQTSGIIDVKVDEDIALVAVVGRNMVTRPGMSGKLFAVLGENSINIKLIAQGSIELSIIVGVSNKDFSKAVRTLYASVNKI